MPDNVYESEAAFGEYMLLHYGAPEEVMPYAWGPRDALDFPVRCAGLVASAAKALGTTPGRALDLGCAVGRASFELARTFHEVVGIDLSSSFIRAAQTLQREGRLGYIRKEEGELRTPIEGMVDPSIDRSRVSFRQGDACDLPPNLAGFDAVLMANLLCRLPDPRKCLARFGGPNGLVRPGGILVNLSPYTWMEQFTPREAWLGGLHRDGAPVRSSDVLCQLLSEEFELIKEENTPLVIREHARKFQYIVSHATVWRRKAGSR